MKENFVDLTELVRSIQRMAGEPDCFRRGISNCDQLDCAWRDLCMELPEEDNHL